MWLLLWDEGVLFIDLVNHVFNFFTYVHVTSINSDTINKNNSKGKIGMTKFSLDLMIFFTIYSSLYVLIACEDEWNKGWIINGVVTFLKTKWSREDNIYICVGVYYKGDKLFYLTSTLNLKSS